MHFWLADRACVLSSVFWLFFAACAILVENIPIFGFIAQHGKLQLKTVDKSVQHGQSIFTVFKNLTVPKFLFVHMYIVGVVCGGFGLMIVTFQYLREGTAGVPSETVICLLLFVFQSNRRLFECWFMTSYGSARMHISGYIIGIAHYIFVPMTIFLRSHPRGMTHHNSTTMNSRLHICMIALGLIIFFVANYFQYMCHKVLFEMKSNVSKDGGKSSEKVDNTGITEPGSLSSSLSHSNHHKFPVGMEFSLLCCPHYFAEILIYASFCFILPTHFPMYCILIWVTSNLSVVANQNMKWYKLNFPHETKKRKQWKRIIPWVW